MQIQLAVRRALFLGAFALLLPHSAVAQGTAYSLDDVAGLLKRHVSNTRVLALAKQNCISFTVTTEVEAKLRRAGATKALLDGLKKVCNPNTPAPAPAADTVPAVAAAPVPVKPAEPPPPVDTTVVVRIRAAVIGSDLTVRSVPQMDLWIISPKGDTTRLSTDLEGKVERSFRTGVYRIESAQPVEIGGSRYRWAFYQPFEKDMPAIELTQKNASIEALPPAAAPTAVASTLPAGSAPSATVATHDSSSNAKPDVAAEPPPPPAPAPKVRTEKEIFEDYRSGLFTVYGSARGTAFLADSTGLVVTNAHLLDGADEVRVQVDTVTKVYARRLVVDPAHDIAVLAIDMKRCAHCAALPLLDSAAKSAAPSPGDRVLALGSPMNKLGVLSLGIVSNADAQSVVSDASVSYLNTGGPLVNMDGYVIALNTNKGMTAGAGPRIATSVPEGVLEAALARARDSLPALARKPPSDSLLPVAPRDPFPTEPIAAVSNLGLSLDLRNYRTEQGPFKVFMMTPQVMAWRQVQAQKALQQKKRDDPKKAAGWTQIDPIEGWRDWPEYLQDRKAVVIFNVTPEKTQFPFYEADKIQGIDEGSFRDMKIYRDGVEIVPVEKVRIPAMLNVDQTRAAGKPVAMQGIYVYRIEDFAPRAVGTVASYSVTLVDASNPTRPLKIALLPAMIEQMWKDFTPYRFGARR